MLEFKIPAVGENIKKGTVVKINVSVGDSVKKDQELLELETDKASIAIPSPSEGVIKEILIKEGQDVNIGQVVMKIDAGTKGQTVKEAPTTAKETPDKKEPVNEKSPSVAETKSQPAAQATAKKSTAEIPAQTDVAAAPSVRRLARELGVNVSQVTGTGPKGRISEDDVKAFVKGIISSGGTGTGVSVQSQPLPDFSRWGDVERKPMSNVRKKTAQHLTYCWTTIPHVTQFDKADITNLETLRKRYSNDKLKLTVTPFLLKVLAAALKNFPQFNSSIDMATQEVIYKKYVNIGVAVDTDRGLLVPVLRDIDKKSIFQLAQELNEIAERARNKKTTIEEMQGSSFTVTNLGGIGGTFFTPIVNWPDVAILGISRGGLEPVIEGGSIVHRFKLPLSLSYDHRIIDGADGARFLRWICEAIEQPFMLEMDK